MKKERNKAIKKFLSLILSIIMMIEVMSMNAFAASNSIPVITLSNVASTGKIKVTWTKVSGAVSYSVWRSTSKNGNYYFMIEKSGTSYTNTSATAGKKYYYQVIAYLSNGEPRESTVKYRTCDLAKPEAMSSLNSDGYPKLIWKSVKNSTSYDVYRATSKNGTYKLMKNTTSTSYVNTSATNGKTYYYKVKAKCGNSAADSVFSKVVPITCLRGMYVKSVTCKNGDVYTFAFEN